MTTTGAGLTRH